MRCHLCERWSIAPICGPCRVLFLQPSLHTRRLPSGLRVDSFFGYDEIEPLLLSKHAPHGWRIYKTLAEAVVEAIVTPPSTTYLIAVDDSIAHGFSHTALLAKIWAQRGFHLLPGALRATHRVRYAGKSRAFRIQNPRQFRYTGPRAIRGVLVDDIVTTGLTLQEAHAVLLRHDVEVLGAITLADANRP